MQKPRKPTPDFPLFAHASGKWAKKIRNRMCYFGAWADPQGALEQYHREREELEAGRRPRSRGAVTMQQLCNEFLESKKSLMEAGDITNRTFADYERVVWLLGKYFGGMRPVDGITTTEFRDLRRHLAKRFKSVESLASQIQRIRAVFKYGVDSLHLQRPEYGQEFRRPPKRTMRLNRAKKLKRFNAAEIRAILAAAKPKMRAMVLLGINCALGNSDCAKLERRHLDLEGGWLEFPRPKTGTFRRCPLWPETIAALKSLGNRTTRVFLTPSGEPYATDVQDSPISREFNRAVAAAKVAAAGRSFYALRHSFRHAADESLDHVAINVIMGHVDNSMGERYRGSVRDERLRAVADRVRKWLFDLTEPEMSV